MNSARIIYLLLLVCLTAWALTVPFIAHSADAFSACKNKRSPCQQYVGNKLSQYAVGLKQDVDEFLGIQYATANRWQAPKAVKSPVNQVTAQQYGPQCPQLGQKTPLNEQCLYLNVWKPSAAKDLPVMVFIHGGAFIAGSGGTPFYSGAQLAGWNDVVVVSLNYRLGIFGFLNNIISGQGNFGLLDQAMAIKWVNKNIKQFGGDPDKITIFGESAGAMSVAMNITNPDNKNMFRNAIMESTYMGIPQIDKKQARDIGLLSWGAATALCRMTEEGLSKADAVKFFKNMASLNTIPKDLKSLIPSRQCLPYNLNPQYLLKVETFFQLVDIALLIRPFPYAPFIDNKPPLEQHPLEEKYQIPVIMGHNRNESTLFIDNWASKNLLARAHSFESIVQFLTSGKTPIDEMLKFDRYNPDKQNQGNKLDNKIQALENIMDDAVFFCPGRQVLAQSKSTTHSYFFEQVNPYNVWTAISACNEKVCHGDELPFVFMNPYNSSGEMVGFRAGEQQLSQNIASYWTNFAKTNTPGSAQGVNWKPFGKSINGQQLRLKNDLDGSYNNGKAFHCNFWQQYLFNDFSAQDINNSAVIDKITEHFDQLLAL